MGPERLKKDVWRCLKTLKREYEDQSKEDTMAPPEDYARLGNWDQKKKQDRRRMQNRKAARRFRVKNLEVVWAMVTSYQKIKAENDQLRRQVKLLGGQVAPQGMPRSACLLYLPRCRQDWSSRSLLRPLSPRLPR